MIQKFLPQPLQKTLAWWIFSQPSCRDPVLGVGLRAASVRGHTHVSWGHSNSGPGKATSHPELHLHVPPPPAPPSPRCSWQRPGPGRVCLSQRWRPRGHSPGPQAGPATQHCQDEPQSPQSQRQCISNASDALSAPAGGCAGHPKNQAPL